MLLIHWTKQRNTGDILKNGIRPTKRKLSSDDEAVIKGVWCYPYTRHKSLNNNWKINLKVWEQDLTNFNGIVFKLQPTDFPIYAGEFSLIGWTAETGRCETYEEFKNIYGKAFSPKKTSFEQNEEYLVDYDDFEMILSQRIEPSRIIKVVKDRNKSYKK